MKLYFIFSSCLLLALACNTDDPKGKQLIPLSVVNNYVEIFNQGDDELYVQAVPNSKAAAFLCENIPRFECPDKQLEETYYFRWWTFRKHIKQIPEGYIITEFLPVVPWAGKYNGEIGSSMHHYNEGRWLHNREYLDSYALYAMRGGSNLRAYSCHVAHSMYKYFLATGDDSLIKEFLPDFIENYEEWEKKRFDESKGLFWQFDGQDAMEVSICGKKSHDASGYRAVINSYMIAEAKSIAVIAKRFGNPAAEVFEKKAAALQEKMLQTLWDKDAQFFKVIPKEENAGLCNARELHGYTPWCYNLASEEYAAAWKFLMDPKHFYAPYGPTTAEQSHPEFTISYEGHECQWNGPSWPFSTTITLDGLANVLSSQQQNFISKKDYFDLLKIYAHSHHLTKEDGTVVPWIDENLNPFTGDWISRTRLKTWENGAWSKGKGGVERGKDYNHSTFCDLVITGLIGVRPQEGEQVTINPLIPADTWDYFCLDDLTYKSHKISVLYDKYGTKYKQGKGFMIFVDRVLKVKTNSVEKQIISL
ncbi:hypothetical protein AGMMS50239_08680 [Bacteroidia bacterium]|nr:hypothetical protein AGMMS50239_08680 [Bacteroidia bacterium]